MSAGDFVRRAAAGMQSTLAQASSTVTNAAQGRKTYDVNSEAMEKCTLSIKCTPKKDAMTTTSLAIKAGYLMKRNEQGQWQKRYICTVPHLFLYYFDSDSSEQPRGIIDLELYHNISRYKNSLKVAAVNEEKMRSFHFQGDDTDNLNDWLTHFMRDRYFAVCEERNAYQQMQSEMTAVLDTIASQTKAVEIDKDIVEKHLEEAILAKEEAVSMLRSMLVIMGITEEEMSRLQDLNRIGHTLQTGIINLKKEVETKLFGPDEALEAEKLAHQQSIATLQEQIDMEVRARKNLEAMLLKQKKASELQAADLGNQIDTLNLNFQLIVASKVEIEEKNASLAEQRRLLIKEVKRTRGKLVDTEASLEKVENVNSKLSGAVSALQAQLSAAQRDIAALKQAAVAAEKNAAAREQAAVTAAVMAAMDAFAAAGATPTHTGTEETDSTVPAPMILDIDAIPVQIGSTSEDLGDTSAAATNQHIAPSAESADSEHTSQDSGAPDVTPDAPAPAGSTANPEAAPTEPLSTEQLQSILAESQAIMLSLRPLSTQRTTGGGSGPGTPRGSLSNSNSGTNLVSSTHSDSGSSGANGVNNSAANQPQSPLDLKELGWLSPEQEKLVDNRLLLHQQQHPEIEAKYKYLGNSNTTAVSDGSSGPAPTEPSPAEESATDAAPSAYETAAITASSTISMLSGAMSLLSSTATATINSASGAQPTEDASSTKRPPRGIISSIFQAEKANPNGVASSSTGADTEEEDPERLPSAMRLNCLRCSGTVEGPKYSTCKCSVPALVPEDLHPTASSASAGSGSTPAKSSWGFSGMFSKSSSVFKEGLAKASQVTASNVESLMHMTKAASASATASSSASGSAESAGADKPPAKKEGYSYYNTVVSSQPAPAAAKAAQPAPSAAVLSPPAPPAAGASAVAGVERVDHESELWGYIVGSKGSTKNEIDSGEAARAADDDEPESVASVADEVSAAAPSSAPAAGAAEQSVELVEASEESAAAQVVVTEATPVSNTAEADAPAAIVTQQSRIY